MEDFFKWVTCITEIIGCAAAVVITIIAYKKWWKAEENDRNISNLM